MFPFTGHVTNKKWPLNEVRRTPGHHQKNQTSDRQSTILPMYYLLCVYCRSTGGTWCGCSKPASSTSRTLTCATRPSRGGVTLYIHYTISTALYLPYLRHFIFHLQHYIYTISTVLYSPYPGWLRSHSRSSCFPSSSSPAASPQQLQLFSARLRAGEIKLSIKGRSGR